MHAAFPSMGSGCFLVMELITNEEKWETRLDYHGKYEEPWRTSAQVLTMVPGLLEELLFFSPLSFRIPEL